MSAMNYWTRRNLSRRGLLRGGAVGLGGLAGAALIGCGGAGEETSAPKAAATPEVRETPAPLAQDTKGILSPRVDTTANAVPGGIVPIVDTDATSLDPLTSTSFRGQFIARRVYPQLLEFKPGVINPGTGEVRPQLALSFEYADPQRLVLKLRKDAKWDQREPTNSRAVDAEDVVWSWKRFETQHVNRAAVANSVNSAAPISSITAIDPSTVEVKTAMPFAPLLQTLAYTRWLQIMPREAESKFDPRNDMRGAGPWVMTKYERSVKFEFRKNPNYWRRDRPFIEGLDFPIIGEYAQRLAQFRAGKVWTSVVNQTDVVTTKKELADLALTQNEFGRGAWQIYFSLRPGSPFLDERVRQAVSYSIDRDLMIETFDNTPEFKKNDYPVSTRWHGAGVAGGYDGTWLDPQGKELGDAAKFWKYNPAEAKKLLQAAGLQDKLKSKLSFIATAEYGTTYPKVGEAYVGMFNASGNFQIEQNHAEYQTEYLQKIYFSKGDFDGMAWGASTTFPVPVQHLFDYYHSKGSRQKVALKGDPASVKGTAESDALIEKALSTLDPKEHVALLHRWQKENAARFPIVVSPWPGGFPGFRLDWPIVQNLLVYRDYLEQWEQVSAPNWWVDRSKPPRA